MILQDPQMTARSRKVSSADEIVSDERLILDRLSDLSQTDISRAQALEQLFLKHFHRLAHFLSLVTLEASVDEICIDVFTVVWRSAAQCPGHFTALTWIIRIGYRQTAARIACPGRPSRRLFRPLGRVYSIWTLIIRGPIGQRPPSRSRDRIGEGGRAGQLGGQYRKRSPPRRPSGSG